MIIRYQLADPRVSALLVQHLAPLSR